MTTSKRSGCTRDGQAHPLKLATKVYDTKILPCTLAMLDASVVVNLMESYVFLSARCEKWIRFYLEEARERLLGLEEDTKALILTIHGQPMPADYLTQLIGRYVKKADIGKSGSCHIFRHSCATNMLDNGCDIRMIQESFKGIFSFQSHGGNKGKASS